MVDRMTPQEFKTHMEELGLNPNLLCRLFGVGRRMVGYWMHDGLDEGVGGATAAVARTLRLLNRLNRQEVKETIQAVLQEEVNLS